MNSQVLLPVWHGVDHSFIVNYSPPLAAAVAVSTEAGPDKVAAEILRAVRPQATSTPSTTTNRRRSRKLWMVPVGALLLLLITSGFLFRNRPVNLSITHKFGRIEPKLDVGESGEPTPHDRITRRRVTRASKIAAQSGQLGDGEGQRPVYGTIDVAIRNKMIKQLALGF